jgi:hypothetical protein
MQLFAPGALDPIVEKIKAHVRGIETDISTEDGRKAIKSLVRKIANSKTFIDKQRETLVGDEKKRLKAIDAEGLRVWNELEALQDEVRAPLTEWEDAEKARVAKHECRINSICAISVSTFTKLPSVDLAEAELDRLWDHNFEEFTKRATHAREVVALYLKSERERITREAAEHAEEQRLKAEREEKKRVEREAKIAEDARLKAEAEAKRREEAIQREAKQREEELARVAAEEKARLERERKESEERLQKSLDDARAKAQRDKLAAEERERKAEADRIAAAEKAEEVLRKIVEGTKERERKAEEERVAALKQELANREAARKKAEDEREKAVQAERKRLEDIRKAEEEKRDAIAREQVRREADQEHRREVHGGAVLALVHQVEDLTSHQARLVVQAIVKGLIPGVSITY